MKLIKNTILFTFGGLSYIIIEMLWRGYSHWSMFVLGGLCFWVIGLINENSNEKTPLAFEMLLGSFFITLLELVCGYIVNIRLKMNIWDYSNMPYNIMGQICLKYTILWFVLSFLCIIVDDSLRYYLFGEGKRKYTLF